MQTHIIHRTEDYRGDHAADVAVGVNVKEGETVEQLVKRVLRQDRPQDWIELHIVKVYESKPNAPAHLPGEGSKDG